MSHLDWSSAYGTIQKQVCRATLALRVCTAVFVPVTTGVIKCFSRPGILHLSRHFRSIVLGVRGGGSVAFRAVAMCGQAGIQNVCMHDLCSTGVFEDALWPMFLVYFLYLRHARLASLCSQVNRLSVGSSVTKLVNTLF